VTELNKRGKHNNKKIEVLPQDTEWHFIYLFFLKDMKKLTFSCRHNKFVNFFLQDTIRFGQKKNTWMFSIGGMSYL